MVARPHPKWGERAMAFVILRTDGAKRWAGRHDAFGADLKKHAKSRLPGFACPEWVQVVDELPVCHVAFARAFPVILTRVSENIDWQNSESGSAQDGREALKYTFERESLFISFSMDS